MVRRDWIGTLVVSRGVNSKDWIQEVTNGRCGGAFVRRDKATDARCERQCDMSASRNIRIRMKDDGVVGRFVE